MAAGIVLAGGRSTRMGAAKAALEWHGSTLLRRVCGLVARGVEGPVVVVRGPGQALPPLPSGVEVVEDAREGAGPLQGLAAGLAAVDAEVAYVSAVDVPFLTPALVASVVAALSDEDEIAIAHAEGRDHFLAAAYRTSLRARVDELLAGGERRLGALAEASRVRRLPADAAAVRNLNAPGDYEAARARPAPEVEVAGVGVVRAATVGAAARAAGVVLPEGADPELPLVDGDVVAADGGGVAVSASAARARSRPLRARR